VFGHPTTFRVNAQNITNEKYWASTGGLFLAESLPSTVKFSIATQF
jgi:iron complex outermembrane receptor protein